MRKLFCTIDEKNLDAVIEKFGPAKVVHRFPEREIIYSYCCREPESAGFVTNIVVEIEVPSRTGPSKSSLVKRVRPKVPEGGWESLGTGTTLVVQQC